MSKVLDLIEAKGENNGRIICYINCRKRNMSIEDAQGISELTDELAEKAEKKYQKETKK